MKRRVYIAGPMRGHPQLNFPAFDAAKQRGESMGWEVFSPADMDRAVDSSGEHCPKMGLDVTPEKCRTFADRDLSVILSLCAERGDAIAVLPGWEKSVGATAEVAVAKWIQLPVISAETFSA